MATALIKKSRHGSRKPVITEAKLRRIIRDELARQILIQEGFTDFIKKPFQMLKDAAKKKLTELVKNIMQSLKEMYQKIHMPEGYETLSQKFVEALKSQNINVTTGKNGVLSAESAASLAPEITSPEEIKKFKEDISGLKIDAIAKSPTENSTNESHDFNKLNFSMILLEEEFEQKKEKLIFEQKSLTKRQKKQLNEIIAATVLGGAAILAGIKTIISTWWTAVKLFAGLMGLLNVSLKKFASVLKFFGKQESAEKCLHAAHWIHEMEGKVLKVIVYPAPVSYASYLAASGAKKGLAAVKGEETEKILSFKEFNSPEHAEEKAASEKLSHCLLMIAITVDAISHGMHAMHGSNEQMLGTLAHSGAEVGIETAGYAAAAGAALGAGADSTGKKKQSDSSGDFGDFGFGDLALA